MKIIEAMKKVKANKTKIADLQAKIAQYCVQLNFESQVYPDQKEQVSQWLQACTDLTQDNMDLLVAIQRTNLATAVTIELGGVQVTKSIAAWVWRRREYALIDQLTWSKLTDKNLREGTGTNSAGEKTEVKIVRFYDPVERDKRVALYRDEPAAIDAALEVVNAVTDLLQQ